MLLTELQRLAGPQEVFFVYAAKTFMTGALLFWLFRRRAGEIPGTLRDGRAVLLGAAVLGLWLIPAWVWPSAGRPVTFNPEVFTDPAARAAAILIRTAGAALVVPVMEELLWRSFLMRYLIQQDFLKIPVGTYRAFSFAVTAAAFTLVHKDWEWPAAAVTGLFYGAYLVKTKNLRGCILAHGVTNLGLAVYVVLTRQWYFW